MGRRNKAPRVTSGAEIIYVGDPASQEDWNKHAERERARWEKAEVDARMALGGVDSQDQLSRERIAEHSPKEAWDHLGSVATSPTPEASGDEAVWE